MPIRKGSVDLADLCGDFEDCRVDHRYYLDLEADELFHVSDEFMDEEEKEKLEEMIGESLGERYLAIPQASSEESYEDMLDFVETVEDTGLREKLYIALDGRGAFRRFRDVLSFYPEEQKKWFKFKDERLTERVDEWLELEGIVLAEGEKPK